MGIPKRGGHLINYLLCTASNSWLIGQNVILVIPKNFGGDATSISFEGGGGRGEVRPQIRKSDLSAH